MSKTNSALIVDTTSTACIIGIFTADKNFQIGFKDRIRHSRNLAPMIDLMLNSLDVQLSDLSYIFCATGPGSFTGIRIGISTVQAISYSLNIPAIGFSSFDVWGFIYKNIDAYVIPVIDAKMKRYYSALYYKGKNLSGYLDIAINELAEKIPAGYDILFCGQDYMKLMDIYQKKPDQNIIKIPGNNQFLNPESIFQYGLELIKKYPDGNNCTPLYLRKSEAEEKLALKAENSVKSDE